MKTFFFVLNNEQHGPFSVEDLLIIGVQKDTLVWAEGMADWEPAGSVPEFLHLLQPVLPALPPVVDPQPILLGVPVGQPDITKTARAIPLASPVALARPTSDSFPWGKTIGGFIVIFSLLLVYSRSNNSHSEADSVADTESVSEAGSEAITEKQHRPKARMKAKADESDNTSSESDASATEAQAAVGERSVPRESTKYWYDCTSCGKVIAASNVPDGGKCPNQTESSRTGHLWEKLGQMGDTQYTCYFCSASIATNSRPERGKCQESPKKDEMSGYGHQWEESGKAVNRY